MNTIYQNDIYFQKFKINTKKVVISGSEVSYTTKGSNAIIESVLMPELDIINEQLIDCIFEKENVNCIKFQKVLGNDFQNAIGKRYIKRKVSEDYILNLKKFKTIDDYYCSFGKKTRQHLKQYRKKFDNYLNESGDKFECVILKGDNLINEEAFERVGYDIYQLNNSRCESKGFSATAKTEWIYIAMKCGVIIYYKLNNVVIAGTILTIVDGQAFLHTIAHDPQFNKYNVGNLILKDTINYMWEQNVKIIHFLWGYSDYKVRFLATEEGLYDVFVYKYDLLYLIGNVKTCILDCIKMVKRKIKPFYHKYLKHRFYNQKHKERK